MATQQYQQGSEHFLAQARRELADGDLAQARRELADGDLPQASQHGWGAVAQFLKAIAEQRGWEHSRHRHYFGIASRLLTETGDYEILPLFGNANLLDESPYENRMTRQDVVDSLDHVETLLDKFLPMLTRT